MQREQNRVRGLWTLITSPVSCLHHNVTLLDLNPDIWPLPRILKDREAIMSLRASVFSRATRMAFAYLAIVFLAASCYGATCDFVIASLAESVSGKKIEQCAKHLPPLDAALLPLTGTRELSSTLIALNMTPAASTFDVSFLYREAANERMLIHPTEPNASATQLLFETENCTLSITFHALDCAGSRAVPILRWLRSIAESEEVASTSFLKFLTS